MVQMLLLLLFAVMGLAQQTAREGDYIEQGLTLPSSTSSSNPPDDACFSSWEVYWAANASVRTISPSFVPNTTITEVMTTLDSAVSAYTSTRIETVTETSYVINGPFTLSTQIWTNAYTLTDTQSSYPASNRTFTYVDTKGVTIPPTNTVQEPDCTLPTLVSQCESQWEQFVTAQLVPTPSPPSHCNLTQGAYEAATDPNAQPACVRTFASEMSAWYSSIKATTQPSCSQASIGGQLCQSVRDSYQQGQNFFFQPDFVGAGPGFHFNGGSLGIFNGFSTSWTWPTSSTLQVPSCTLGCGRCAITGGTVQLLWWPPATSTDSANKEMATFVTDGTTLTSPTLYISYSKMHAQNGCGDVGNTITSTIIPIPTTQTLSSVWGFGLPCDAHERNEQDQYQLYTASFNVTDLVEPVPQSIYTSMPRCATEMHCGGTCKMDDAYKPILVVPHDVLRDIQPAWADCFGDLNGVYDPPVALQRVSTIAAPTIPGGVLPGPTAEPGGSVQPDIPQITNHPPPPTTKPEPEHPNVPPNDPVNSRPLAGDPPVGTPPSNDPLAANVPENNQPATSPGNGVIVDPFPEDNANAPVAGPPLSNSAPSSNAPGTNTPQQDPPYVYQPIPPASGSEQPRPVRPFPQVPSSNVNAPSQAASGSLATADEVMIPVGTTIIPVNNQTQIVLGSVTLTPGGPALTVSSTTYSLQASASALVVNGQTLAAIPPTSSAGTTSDTPTALTFAAAELTVSPVSGGQVVKGPSIATISANAAGITIAGVPISLGSSGQLVIGTSMMNVPYMSPTTSSGSSDTSSGTSTTQSSPTSQQSGSFAGQIPIPFASAKFIALLSVLAIL